MQKDVTPRGKATTEVNGRHLHRENKKEKKCQELSWSRESACVFKC